MEPLVDINIAVYNQAPYIRQTLDSVLAQQTDFPFRLLIGDDCSTDGSVQILKEYEEKYPDRIKVIFQPTNLGLNAAERNGTILLKNSTAKYIALLDGDDFWTTPHKLQKQVEFLEKNPDFAICFHNSNLLYEENPEKVAYSNPPEQADVTTFEDLAKGEYIYTATCLFRMTDFKKFPQKSYIHINNYTIDLHNAQFGKIKYINEVMTTYRIHKNGMWSMVPREKTLINQLPAYKFYVNYFDKKYKSYFLAHLRSMTNELIDIKLGKNDFKDFWKYYKDYVFYNFRSKEIKRIGYIFLKANYENAIKFIRRK